MGSVTELKLENWMVHELVNMLVLLLVIGWVNMMEMMD